MGEGAVGAVATEPLAKNTRGGLRAGRAVARCPPRRARSRRPGDWAAAGGGAGGSRARVRSWKGTSRRSGLLEGGLQLSRLLLSPERCQQLMPLPAGDLSRALGRARLPLSARPYLRYPRRKVSPLPAKLLLGSPARASSVGSNVHRVGSPWSRSEHRSEKFA